MFPVARIRTWVVIALALVLGVTSLDAQEATHTFQLKNLQGFFTKPAPQGTAPLKILKVTPQQQVPLPANGNATVQVARKDYLFQKSGELASVLHAPAPGTTTPPAGALPHRPNPRIRIPWEFVSASPQGEVRRFVPYLQVENGGLLYSARERRYRGTVTVGLVDELSPEAPAEALEQAVLIQFALTRPGEVRPTSSLDLDHTGIPFDSLTVSIADTASLIARTRADAQGVAVPLPTRPLELRIVIQPSDRLAGFGLSRGRVTVQPPPELAAGDTLGVTLRGGFDFDHAEIASPGGEASFRAALPGTYEIEALVNGRTVGRTPVKVDWPWVHLIVLAIGAVLAGLARLTEVQGGRGGRVLLGQIARAAPFSVIIGLGGALGVDWFGWKLPDFGSFAAILVVAAVGGWLGAKVLDNVMK